MTKPIITDHILRESMERARFERSLAFHATLHAIGMSVQYLFTQPERIIDRAATKKRDTQGRVTRQTCDA